MHRTRQCPLRNRSLRFAYAESGQPHLAVSDCTRAIALNPNLTAAYELRGAVHMLRLNNKADACADWEKACDLGACRYYRLSREKGDCR